MKQANIILTVWLAALLALLSACRHDDDLEPTHEVVPEDGTWKVVLDIEAPFAKEAAYQSVTATIEGRADADSIILVSASSEGWLTVMTDTLPKDGIVRLAIAANDGDETRKAMLSFTSAADKSRTASAEVSQSSVSSQNTNGVDAKSVLYIGYGYDIYTALDNPMSVRTTEPVIDYMRLVEYTNKGYYAGDYEPVQFVRLARTEIKYVMSNTIQAHAEHLADQQCANDLNIQGCTVDCDNVGKICMEGDMFNQNIGRASMIKTVASRVLDKGALLNMRSVNKSWYHIPFSDGFSYYLDKLLRKNGNGTFRLTGEDRKKVIVEMIRKYGTHVVIQVDIGGRIDYTFTKSKYSTVNFSSDMQEEMDFTLGRIAEGERKSLLTETSSHKNVSGAITIKGGSEAARRQLENDVQGLDEDGQLPSQHVVEWLASINYSEFPQNDPNLEVVHFELIPLWDLLNDELRPEILAEVLDMMSTRSDCQVNDDLLGTDIYVINATKKKELFDFSKAGTDGSLCRILYIKDIPVLEVCSEYVPKIRTDQRVTIAYPIYKQRIRINEGLFLGDGIHQPAVIGFSGSDCFVLPLTDCPADSVITQFYYINGNLVPSVRALNAFDAFDEQQCRPVVKDDVLPLITSEDYEIHQHPVVKVGSTFWTRHDIKHPMEFTEDPDDYNGDYFEDVFDDGIIFTRFMWGNSPDFTKHNKWIYEYKPNTMFEGNPNQKWYLPQPSQVTDLYAYLGFNPKALFKGQVSGFEAEFNGYIGASDIKDNGRYFTPYDSGKRRYKGEVNVICSKNSDDVKDACLMVLDKNYKLSIVSDKNSQDYWRENYYTVRPCRGYMFLYPTIKDINQNTNL